MKKRVHTHEIGENPLDVKVNGFQTTIRSRRRTAYLDQKFSHQPLEELLGPVARVAMIVSFLAQLGSMVTGFKSMTILMKGIPTVVMLLLAVVGLFAVEFGQRSASNYTIKGFVQYGKVYHVAFCIACSASIASVALSYFGSRMLPNDLIADAEFIAPELIDIQAVKEDYDQRIEDKKADREAWKAARLWNDRLSRKDANVVKGYTKDIDQLHRNKDEAVRAAQAENQQREAIASQRFDANTTDVAKARQEQGLQLVLFSMALELLFWLCLVFKWWYDFRCKLERAARQELANPQQTENDAVDSPSTVLNTPQQGHVTPPQDFSMPIASPQRAQRVGNDAVDSPSTTLDRAVALKRKVFLCLLTTLNRLNKLVMTMLRSPQQPSTVIQQLFNR